MTRARLRRKSPAQLDSEIAEALARSSSRSHHATSSLGPLWETKIAPARVIHTMTRHRPAYQLANGDIYIAADDVESLMGQTVTIAYREGDTHAARSSIDVGSTAHATKQSALPFHTERCYACDSKAIGVRDRRPEGGLVEAACKRHADPTIKAHKACMYCSGPRPTLLIDGDFAHKSCHDEASQ